MASGGRPGQWLQRGIFSSDPHEALAHLTAAVDACRAAGPGHALGSQAFYRRCVLYMWLGWSADALQDASEGARWGQGDVFGLLCESTVAELEGNDDKATQLCHQAVARAPESSNAKVALSYCLCKGSGADSHRDAAAALLREVIEMYALRFGSRGRAAVVEGESDEATALHASELSAAAMAWNNIAVGHSEVGNAAAATDAFGQAVALLPVYKTLVGWARHSALGKSEAEAVRIWDQLIGERLVQPESQAAGLVERSRVWDSYGMGLLDLQAAHRLAPSLDATASIAYALQHTGLGELAGHTVAASMVQAHGRGNHRLVRQLQAEATTYAMHLAGAWADRPAYQQATAHGNRVMCVSEALRGSQTLAIAYASGAVRVLDLAPPLAALSSCAQRPGMEGQGRGLPAVCVDIERDSSGAVTALALGPGLDLVAVASADGSLQVYYLAPPGGRLVAASQLEVVVSAASFECVGVAPPPSPAEADSPGIGREREVGTSLGFSQCGGYVVVGGVYGSLAVYRLQPAHLALVARACPHQAQAPMQRLAVLPPSPTAPSHATLCLRVLVPGPAVGLDLWAFPLPAPGSCEVGTGRLQQRLGVDTPIVDFVLFPQGERVACLGYYGDLLVFAHGHPDALGPVHATVHRPPFAQGPTASPVAAAPTAGPGTALPDMLDGGPRDWAEHVPRASCLAVSPDGMHIAVGLRHASDPLLLYTADGRPGPVFVLPTTTPAAMFFHSGWEPQGLCVAAVNWAGQAVALGLRAASVPHDSRVLVRRLAGGHPVSRLATLASEACRGAMVAAGCFEGLPATGRVETERWGWAHWLPDDTVQLLVGRHLHDHHDHLRGGWPPLPDDEGMDSAAESN